MPIPETKKTVLDNGITVVSENIPTLKSAAVGIMVGAGSMNELKGEEGLTHFIEHMAFKGTQRRSAFDIASELDAVGGRLNAYTSKENTVYHAVVLDKHINVALDVLTDIFLQPALKEQDINMERGVILEEINMYEDTPDELIHDLFAEAIIKNHPAGKPTIGNKKSVSSFKQENFTKYRDRLYRPDNVIISAAGAVNHDDIVKAISKVFEKFSGRKQPQQFPAPDYSPERKIKKKETEQLHLCIGTKGLSQVDERRYIFSAMEAILGGSMSSRLFQEVREKRGLAYSIYSTSMPLKDIGVFYVYAGIDKKNFEQVADLIIGQFSKIKKDGITAVELARAKEHLKGGLVLGLESSSARMGYIAKSEYYYGRTITVDEIFGEIDKITNHDIILLAEEIFSADKFTLAAIGDIDNSQHILAI